MHSNDTITFGYDGLGCTTGGAFVDVAAWANYDVFPNDLGNPLVMSP